MDKDIPSSYLNINPNPQKIKIGVFGDSNTVGWETNYGEDFPTILQHFLGDQYQVINFGKSGYNFNQIYLAMNYFMKVFDLDQIILGPKGMFLDRLTTFNNYWHFGNIPYSRFILKSGNLKEITIEGETIEERIKNFYSFFPSINLFKHDHGAISFYRTLEILFNREFPNPFFKNKRKVDLRKIQQLQLINTANNFNKPFIHYTDSREDCLDFNNIKVPNYHLHCAKPFLKEFPNYSKISHPSTFGQLRHAQNLAKIILKKDYNPKFIEFHDNKDQLYETSIENLSGQEIDLKSFGTVFKNKPFAKISPNYQLKDRTGRLSHFENSFPNCLPQCCILLGIYSTFGGRLNSLFIPIELNNKTKGWLNKLKVIAIKKIKNVAFYKLQYGHVKWLNNRIYSPLRGDKLLESALFKEAVDKHGKRYFSPIANSYKLVVKKEISAIQFLKEIENQKVLLEYSGQKQVSL